MESSHYCYYQSRAWEKEDSCRYGWEYCFCCDRFCYEIFIKKILWILGKLVSQGWEMYVSYVVIKDVKRAVPNELHCNKYTDFTFTGKAKQDEGAVMAIYQSVLKQLKDFPCLESIIDKYDNSGCSHNEVLFAWKVHWLQSNLNLRFLKILFNEGS